MNDPRQSVEDEDLNTIVEETDEEVDTDWWVKETTEETEVDPSEIWYDN